MSFEIRMPKLSDNMEEGTVIRWIVDKGQTISAGDPIAEVETDKADVEIEAEQSGVVSEIVVAEGGVAAVGAVIARLGDADDTGDEKNDAAGDEKKDAAEKADERRDVKSGRDEDDGQRGKGDGGEAAEADRAAKESDRDDGEGRQAEAKSMRKDDGKAGADRRSAAPPRRQAAGDRGGEVLASPVARELAEKNGVDLSRVKGSGPGGRIVKADVESAAAEAPAAETRGSEERGAEEGRGTAVADAGGETMSRMRRTIAARMEKSKREIPHFYVRTEVDVGDLMRLYETAKADELIPGLTVTHLLLRAIAVTMPHHRRLNALWVDDSIQLVDDVNIGVVVALDDGLLVPVLKRAQTLGLRDLVEQTRALIDRTRKGRFRSEDLSGGTISVSNIGMLDIDELTPVINPPQASIIGVGAVREKALVRDGALVAGRVMTLTLACDHRIVHGVEAGRFLEELKHTLERPLGLVVLG